jgi:hypothetical protein
MGVVTPLNNPGGPEGDTVTVAEKLLNTDRAQILSESMAAGQGRIGQTENSQIARTGAVACQASTAVQVWPAEVVTVTVLLMLYT